ncbi:MAG: hypothetical protein UHX00_13190 [Caryophanon sp.]|nr:hypothetical protein [Caryophanon sp.]
MRYTRFYVMLVSAVLLLMSCTGHPATELQVSSEPLPVAETNMLSQTKLLGIWNDQLLFLDENMLYTYDVTTGQRETIYTANLPMRHVLIHPSGNTMLIVSAKSDAVAQITLWSRDMERLYEVDIASYEVVAAFDQTNATQFSVSAFSKNYEATVYTYIHNELQMVQTKTPFVHMRNGQLYTVNDEQITEAGKVIIQQATHAFIGASDIYYVTADAPNVVQSANERWTLPEPVLSLHEQHEQLYAWLEQHARYELLQIPQMTSIVSADAPVPFIVDSQQRFVVYGEQYEWLQQHGQPPMNWLSIDEK